MSNITPTKGSIGTHAHGIQRVNFEYGRSKSGLNPSLDISSGTDYKFNVTVNGDGPHSVNLLSYQTLNSPNEIAEAIQNVIRGITANDPTLNLAFSQFRCSFDTDSYVLTSGLHGSNSTVQVSDAVSENIAPALKLGTSNGGLEDTYYPNQTVFAELVHVTNPLEISNTESNPIPVEIVGVDEINIGEANLNVDLNGFYEDEPDSVQITGSIDGSETGEKYGFVNNIRKQILAAHDRDDSISWADFGNKNERITEIAFTSPTFSGITIKKSFAYTQVGNKYRLDTITWSVV